MKKRQIKKLLKKVANDECVTHKQSQWLLKRRISHYKKVWVRSPGYDCVVTINLDDDKGLAPV